MTDQEFFELAITLGFFERVAKHVVEMLDAELDPDQWRADLKQRVGNDATPIVAPERGADDALVKKALDHVARSFTVPNGSAEPPFSRLN